MISVIIPVYNTQKYIRRCLNSIVNQTYKDLEIILVDDGSTDGSGNTCDEYARLDSRIIVIHQNNKGLSGARNAGIRRSTAEYITFIDSDDYIDLDTYEVVDRCIGNWEPDLIIFRDKTVDQTGKTIHVNGIKPTEKIYLKNKEFAEELILGKLANSVCTKVYRKSIVKEIAFVEGKLHGEDFLYNVGALIGVNKVAYIDQLKYSYVSTPNSITRGNFTPSRFDELFFKDAVLKMAEMSFPEYVAICKKRAYLARLHICRPIYKQHLENRYEKEINEIKEYLRSNIQYSRLNILDSVEYCLLNYSKYSYLFFINLLYLRIVLKRRLNTLRKG